MCFLSALLWRISSDRRLLECEETPNRTKGVKPVATLCAFSRVLAISPLGCWVRCAQVVLECIVPATGRTPYEGSIGSLDGFRVDTLNTLVRQV